MSDPIVAFFTAPINAHGTPYVSIPEDFSIAEQTRFCALIEQDRLVTRDEQVTLLRAIRDARRETMSDLTILIRGVVERVERGGPETARIEAQAVAEELARRGLGRACHVGRATFTPEEALEWYAGQFIDIVEGESWLAMNSWLNVVDKFAPVVTPEVVALVAALRDIDNMDGWADITAGDVEGATGNMSNAERAAYIRRAIRAGADIPEVCEADCREPVTEHDIEGIPLCAACAAEHSS